jgi:ubiquinone/menaquinone biosynthesis C-methylase UbiE
MSTEFAPGLHVVAGKAVNAAAYDRWVGRWSRLFVPSLLAAARVASGSMVLDASTGTGEAAAMALPIVGSSGLVVGADIAPEMIEAARIRLSVPSFQPVAADGQALPFKDDSFTAVTCQLGLQFFSDAAQGLKEFRRVLRPGAWASVCVPSSPDQAPMWSVLAETLSSFLPEQRSHLYLSWALGDRARLENLFVDAGFQDVRVVREARTDIVGSFDEYWEAIEAGPGQQPQSYLALPEADRRAVREQVKTRLARFATDGRLSMSVEMLIGRGRA